MSTSSLHWEARSKAWRPPNWNLSQPTPPVLLKVWLRSRGPELASDLIHSCIARIKSPKPAAEMLRQPWPKWAGASLSITLLRKLPFAFCLASHRSIVIPATQISGLEFPPVVKLAARVNGRSKREPYTRSPAAWAARIGRGSRPFLN